MKIRAFMTRIDKRLTSWQVGRTAHLARSQVRRKSRYNVDRVGLVGLGAKSRQSVRAISGPPCCPWIADLIQLLPLHEWKVGKILGFLPTAFCIAGGSQISPNARQARLVGSAGLGLLGTLLLLPGCLIGESGDGSAASPTPATSSPADSPGVNTPTGDDDSPTGDDDTVGDDDATAEPTPTPAPPNLHCGTVVANETWYVVDNPHIVTCNVSVEGEENPTLTLEAGLEVRFEGASGLYIGNNAPGSFSAVGNASTPIIFTYADQPGYWTGISFGSQTEKEGAQLEYVRIEGGGNAAGAALSAVGEARETGASGGVLIRAVYVEVMNFSGDGFAFSRAGFAEGSSDLVITENGGAVGSIETDFLQTLPPGNYSGNAIDSIDVSGGAVRQSQRWENPGVSLIMNTNVIVEDDTAPTLTLSAGLVLQFRPGFGMYIGNFGAGALAIEGTADAPVLLTAAEPAYKGAWAGLKFGVETVIASCVLDHFVVEYGGGSDAYANILLQGASPTLRDGLIQQSSGYGLCMDDTSMPTIERLTYVENAAGDLCPTY